MGLETILIGGAVAGAVGQTAAGFAGASATQDAAQANLAAQEQARKDAVAAATPTAAELAAQAKAIEFSNKAIERQEKLLAAIDPAIVESGKQALALLRGQEAAALDPLRAEQARSRTMLQNKLRAQLGSGFETSSAGIEALARFESGAQGQLAQAQERSLGQLLGFAGQMRPNEAVMAQLAGTEAGFLGAQRRDLANAIAGTPVGNQGQVDAAGAAAQAQAFGQAFGGLSNLSSTAAGYSMAKDRLALDQQRANSQDALFSSLMGPRVKLPATGKDWSPFGDA